jgi:hypothetical protein
MKQLQSLIMVVLFTPMAMQSHGHEAVTTQPVSLQILNSSDAVNAAAFFARQVRSDIKYNELQKVHAAAFAASDAATSAVAVMDKQSSMSSAIQTHASRIAAIAKQLDKYADNNRPVETKAFADMFDREIAALAQATGDQIDLKYVPKAAGGGTYLPHMDHKPRHGGIFFMSEDQFHHLEGTYPSAGIFRLYLYDDHTRPISSVATSGTLFFANKGYVLKPASNAPYLEAQITGNPQPPVSLELHLKLPSASGSNSSEELFNFDFDSFSADPNVAGETVPVKATLKTSR